jgi:hypothetical protein
MGLPLRVTATLTRADTPRKYTTQPGNAVLRITYDLAAAPSSHNGPPGSWQSALHRHIRLPQLPVIRGGDGCSSPTTQRLELSLAVPSAAHLIKHTLSFE